MLELDRPINLSFKIAATDPLGREEVLGKLCFLPKLCELHWQLSANVFRGGKGQLQVTELPYSAIGEVYLKKRWLRPSLLTLQFNDPALLQDIPNVDMGKLTFEVDKESSQDLNKLKGYIDFKQSIFLFEQANAHLDELRS